MKLTESNCGQLGLDAEDMYPDTERYEALARNRCMSGLTPDRHVGRDSCGPGKGMLGQREALYKDPTMKTSNNALLLAAALASQATALVQMDVRYSDNMIDVGNIDLFAQTWQILYDTAGNERSVVTDKDISSDNNPCTSENDSSPDLTVSIKMTGAWGQTPGLEQNQMRDGLIQSAWEVLRNIADRNKYNVYGGCTGFTWQESVPGDANAPCGPKAATTCEEACKDESDIPGSVECSLVTTGYKVPSELRVTAYIDDQLQPDDLIISIESVVNPVTGGCGISGEIAKAVANFIPVAGSLFSQGIMIGCTGVPEKTT
ncbi:hypothetical protein SLS58_010861 [Diplodia intermedia]|uniref:Uncharacterized protein n=1 Tax=Diplodia intermedia TaxID=856260 RepID=A0ABR3T3A0_9PEZI